MSLEPEQSQLKPPSRLKRSWGHTQHLRHEPDLGIGIVLAVVFAVLHLLDVVGGAVVGAATLALLALVASSLVLERQERDELTKTLTQVRQELALTAASTRREIDDAISALSSDYAYHTRWLELRYDLGAHGATAVATKTREIRFTRNDVLSISEQYSSDGRGSELRILGGNKGGYTIPLPTIRKLLDDRGRRIELVSLEKPRKRGEVMVIASERTLIDSFLGTREYVNVEVLGGIDEVIFQIIWPRENPPLQLELSRQGARGKRMSAIPLERLTVDADDRFGLVERIADPEDGETITLLWEWNVHPSS